MPKAAPEPLRLVQRFVNTVDLERGRDWLDARWLQEHALAERELDEAELAALRRFREDVRAALGGGRAPEWRATAELRLAGGAVTLEAAGDGVDVVVGRLLAIALPAQSDGRWSRLKTCRKCRWAFYDYSRNRSATWCSMSICGNRSKTRAYRGRRTES